MSDLLKPHKTSEEGSFLTREELTETPSYGLKHANVK